MNTSTMSNLWKLVAVAIGAALVACQWTPPHSSALEEARRALKMARNDPLIAQAAADELHDAQLALRRAQRSWIETRDDATTSHLAYVAFQRVQIARNVGLQREAEQRLQRARAEGQNLLAAESAREPPAAARAMPATLVPAPAIEPTRAQVPLPAGQPPATDAPAPGGAEDAKPDAPAGPAATPARATRSEPAALAPSKPSLPLQVQARAAAPKKLAGNNTRHERKAGATQVARHVAQRPPRKGSSPARAAPPAPRVAAAKPEVWYLEAQGRPAELTTAPDRSRSTASVAEVDARHLRQQRRMQALYAGGHGRPE